MSARNTTEHDVWASGEAYEPFVGRWSRGVAREFIEWLALAENSPSHYFVLNALIETDRIRITTGTPHPIPVPTDSGRPHDVYRCPGCQVALLEKILVAVGA